MELNLNTEKLKDFLSLEIATLILSIIFILIKTGSKYLKTSFPLWFNTLFTRRASIIAKIHIILRKLLYKLEGDRVSLFIFSGGDVKLENENLLMTSVNEVLEDGIASSINERRKLVVQNFGILENLLKEEIINIKDFPLENSSLSAFLISQNTKQALLRLVKDKNQKPVGFIILEYCRNISTSTDDKIKKEINSAKDKLSLLI